MTVIVVILFVSSGIGAPEKRHDVAATPRGLSWRRRRAGPGARRVWGAGPAGGRCVRGAGHPASGVSAWGAVPAAPSRWGAGPRARFPGARGQHRGPASGSEQRGVFPFPSVAPLIPCKLAPPTPGTRPPDTPRWRASHSIGVARVPRCPGGAPVPPAPAGSPQRRGPGRAADPRAGAARPDEETSGRDTGASQQVRGRSRLGRVGNGGHGFRLERPGGSPPCEGSRVEGGGREARTRTRGGSRCAPRPRGLRPGGDAPPPRRRRLQPGVPPARDRVARLGTPVPVSAASATAVNTLLHMARPRGQKRFAAASPSHL